MCYFKDKMTAHLAILKKTQKIVKFVLIINIFKFILKV